MRRFLSCSSSLVLTNIIVLLSLAGCGGMRGAGALQNQQPPTLQSKMIFQNENYDGDFGFNNVAHLLANGHAVPVMILAYTDPGNTDLALLRDIVHRADANATVDQDLNRERNFTDYPYTIDSYLVSVASIDAYKNILEAQTRFPQIKMVIFPVFKVELRSYLKLSYTKILFKDPTARTFWIGDSPPLDFSADVSANVEDPSSYLPVLSACDEFSSRCYDALLKSGYFNHRVLIGDQILSPLSFLDSQLDSSLSLMRRGDTGDSLRGSVLGWTTGKTLLRNITLTHEIWASGPAPAVNPSDVLFKVEGYEQHPIVVHSESAGKYFYELPVSVSEGAIPLRIRNTPSKMIELFEQLKKQIATALEQL